MKKQILIALIAVFIPSLAFGGSAIMKPKPIINDTLTPDNPNWTGITYDGHPLRYGSDAIGANINYLTQVVISSEKDGSFTVQLYSKGLASSAFLAAKNNSTANNPTLGVTSISFQDSGIVIPRSLYSHSIFTEVTLNWSWSIITVFKLNAGQGAAFKSSFTTWSAGKFPFTAASGSATYYWK